MARLWEDGFDHYGTTITYETVGGVLVPTIANALDGSYARASGQISTSIYSTGNASYYCNVDDDFAVGADGLRKVLPSAKSKMGAMGRFYFPSLPNRNYEACIFGFMTSSPNRSQISVIVDANGCLRFVRGIKADAVSTWDPAEGATNVLVAQTDPIITAGAWHHIEVQINIHDTTGWVRVAVNNTHRYAATGLDTAYNSDNIVSVQQHRPTSCEALFGSLSRFYMEDYVLYDFTGTAGTDTDFCPAVDGSGVATNYIGDLQVYPLFPNGDTAEADWTKSTGIVGYSLIDDTSANDTDYIQSSTATDLSEFDLTDLPTEITYVRGLGIHARLSKSDGGTCTTQVGMKSVAATSDATARSITVEPTYWNDQINVDPDSSARWTRASLNAAKLRITRAS